MAENKRLDSSEFQGANKEKGWEQVTTFSDASKFNVKPKTDAEVQAELHTTNRFATLDAVDAPKKEAAPAKVAAGVENSNAFSALADQ